MIVVMGVGHGVPHARLVSGNWVVQPVLVQEVPQSHIEVSRSSCTVVHPFIECVWSSRVGPVVPVVKCRLTVGSLARSLSVVHPVVESIRLGGSRLVGPVSEGVVWGCRTGLPIQPIPHSGVLTRTLSGALVVPIAEGIGLHVNSEGGWYEHSDHQDTDGSHILLINQQVGSTVLNRGQSRCATRKYYLFFRLLTNYQINIQHMEVREPQQQQVSPDSSSLANSPEQEPQQDKPIRFKDALYLGSLLPGQSTSVSYSIEETSNDVQFVSIELSPSSAAQGFCISKNIKSQNKYALNVVLKAKTTQKILIHVFAPNVEKSTEVRGLMKILIGKEVYDVNLYVKIEVPKIFCPKFLHNLKQGLNLIRITINKLVTSEGRINMINMEKYPMEFQIEVMGKGAIDKDCPYNLASSPEVVSAAAQKPFMFTVSISTNIFFKGQMNNLKKVILRKVLLLKTNSSIVYTIPLQIIVVYVKQPEIKE